jgi:glyoxylase-like metal-dependent hydrolase (beta-lactamase superfamily II)
MFLLLTAFAVGQTVPKFDASGLVQIGDKVKYGSYEMIKIGNGIYQIKDYGDPKALAGGRVGTDMYMILGTTKALMVDLGNNYITGYKGDAIPPRNNAEAEFLAIVDGLRGSLPVEAAITHAHPDHDGMTMALANRKATIWMPKGEDMEAPRTQHGIDPAVYTVFDQQIKTWDLGGGRVVTPIMVRGHTNGCSVYLLASETMLFTGDCLGIGAGRSLRTAEQLKMWAEDTPKLVSYIENGFKPFQRYGLKVFTGHSLGNPVEGFVNSDHPKLDLDYLDWRFVQDQALCANAIVKGLWLKPNTGLYLMERTNPQTGQKTYQFLYGIGAADMPLAEAYKAAGLPAPADGTAK